MSPQLELSRRILEGAGHAVLSLAGFPGPGPDLLAVGADFRLLGVCVASSRAELGRKLEGARRAARSVHIEIAGHLHAQEQHRDQP